jgi:hypothetical protein
MRLTISPSIIQSFWRSWNRPSLVFKWVGYQSLQAYKAALVLPVACTIKVLGS